jgi:hypothetical protein
MRCADNKNSAPLRFIFAREFLTAPHQRPEELDRVSVADPTRRRHLNSESPARARHWTRQMQKSSAARNPNRPVPDRPPARPPTPPQGPNKPCYTTGSAPPPAYATHHPIGDPALFIFPHFVVLTSCQRSRDIAPDRARVPSERTQELGENLPKKSFCTHAAPACCLFILMDLSPA